MATTVSVTIRITETNPNARFGASRKTTEIKRTVLVEPPMRTIAVVTGAVSNAQRAAFRSLEADEEVSAQRKR